MLRLPICSFIELSEVACLLFIKALHPLLYMYNEVNTNHDLFAEHSNQTFEKPPEMKPGIDLHSLVFNVLPSTKIKKISQATHLFIFLRPNGRRALSQHESPSNVVTLTERPVGRRPFMDAACTYMNHCTVGLWREVAVRVTTWKSSHWKGSFMESFKFDCTSSVLGIGHPITPICSALWITITPLTPPANYR